MTLLKHAETVSGMEKAGPCDCCCSHQSVASPCSAACVRVHGGHFEHIWHFVVFLIVHFSVLS